MSNIMRPFILVAVLGSLLAASAQDAGNTNPVPIRVSALEAKKHYNVQAIVSGKVAEVNVAERLVRLNFERAYPSNAFTVVIFSDKTNLFPNVRELKNKTVEVTGRIAEYRGHPEIILTDTNQLKVIEKDQNSGTEAKKE
jgi:hypothetical protein